MTDKTELIKMYSDMVKIRAFEDKLSFLFTRGKVHGTVHFCIGQESVAVGACSALIEGDFVTGNHRSHGHAIAKGMSPKFLMAEITGRVTGCCSGIGGTQHVASNANGFLANGITAGLTPVAVGIALAFKIKKRNNVVLAFFGDGAMNEGHFHEAINLATVWKLPVIFICENNLYAMSTHVSLTYNIPDLAKRGSAYGLPAETIDGNDVELVKNTIIKYVETARSGGGPALIECKTYRFCGHSRNDLRLYRTREEEELKKQDDPIRRLKEKLSKNFKLSENEIEKIEQEAQKEVEEAAEFALASPEISEEDANKNIWSC